MPVDHTERAFEAAIEDHLLTQGGYAKADPATFDRERANGTVVKKKGGFEQIGKARSLCRISIILPSICRNGLFA